MSIIKISFTGNLYRAKEEENIGLGLNQIYSCHENTLKTILAQSAIFLKELTIISHVVDQPISNLAWPGSIWFQQNRRRK